MQTASHQHPHRLRYRVEQNTVDGQAAYFAALEAADHRDFQPLVNISRDHPAHAETPDA